VSALSVPEPPATPPAVQPAAPSPPPGGPADFTLDAQELARRREAHSRQLHTLQIPAMRVLGFSILSVMAWAVVRPPQAGLGPLLLANAAYTLLSWVVLLLAHGRTRWPVSLLFMHADLPMWLLNLHYLEAANPLFAFLLLFRVADQVGFGFRRALYFHHLVVMLYLLYAAGLQVFEPARAHWPERGHIAGTLYLMGLYLSLTGLVISRLRARTRHAVQTARALVSQLRDQNAAMQAQAEALREARQRAEEASAAKSQFLAVISHEIRTPMNGVLGAAQLLATTGTTPRQQHYVDTILQSGNDLMALIEDTLQLSTLDIGKLALKPVPTSPRQLTMQAVATVAPLLAQTPIALLTQFEAQLPACVEVDPLRLRQVLLNLLHNAVKFTRQGRIEARLQLAPGSAADSALPRLRWEVEDTGIGIAPEHLASVFEPFTQVDASPTRRQSGSGLGLAIVRALVERLGGTVGVRSEPGSGSMFWVELPLPRCESAAIESLSA
jgi:signal transduction histidine kinase